jgi:hypothetical protein
MHEQVHDEGLTKRRLNSRGNCRYLLPPRHVAPSKRRGATSAPKLVPRTLLKDASRQQKLQRRINRKNNTQRGATSAYDLSSDTKIAAFDKQHDATIIDTIDAL